MQSIVGIIGGTGLYQLDGFEQTEERRIETPFGEPSDALIGGRFEGRQLWFLPRHGRGHRLLPHEINHRANFWALKSVGVTHVISVTAVGSLKVEYKPRQVVLPDQFYDRTSRREHHTFFGEGIVAHVDFGDPTSDRLREILNQACTEEGVKFHDGGTYVNMDGPAFSTRAESNAYRAMGFDVIGMTNLPEAKLARESEIALGTLAMITDYDCWHEDNVTSESVVQHLQANAATAKAVLARALPNIPESADWPEHRSLEEALFTSPADWPQATAEKLAPILERLKG